MKHILCDPEYTFPLHVALPRRARIMRSAGSSNCAKSSWSEARTPRRAKDRASPVTQTPTRGAEDDDAPASRASWVAASSIGLGLAAAPEKQLRCQEFVEL